MLTFIKLTGIKGENVLINTDEILSIREVTYKYDSTSSKIDFFNGYSIEVREPINKIEKLLTEMHTVLRAK